MSAIPRPRRAVPSASRYLTPIETRYKGYRFRSRLEARWAVFLDTIGWQWEYEPQGYDLGGGVWYLPDFLIEGNVWLEVKGSSPTSLEHVKARSLCRQSGIPVVFAVGMPDERSITEGLVCYDCRDEHAPVECGFYILGYKAYLLDTEQVSPEENEVWVLTDRDYDAIDAARSARFEFGEQG